MMSHPLFDALVQPSQPLPAHFRSGVGMPTKLPKLLRYGPIAPPQVGGSQFTGGRVAQPQTSMAHPQAAQGFTPPHFNPSNPTAPSLAPFVQTAQGGLPTGPPFNVAGGGIGGPTGATVPRQGEHGITPTPLGAGSPMDAVAASTHPPTAGGIDTGGYTNTAQVLAGLLGLGPPSPTVSAAPPTRTGGYYQAPSILQTILAQQGQRLNPSGGTRYAQ